ncbi:MAG: 50S ribosomal protein L11 methyltransferase [Pseudomonadota bacterium]
MLLLFSLLLACQPVEPPASTPPPDAFEALPPVSPASGGFDHECGEGDASDYVEIYPSNIVDVGQLYYFQDLGGVLTRFQTIPFDKYSMAVFQRAFSALGGLGAADRVLDIGTGTGALGLAALAAGAHSVVGTDLDPIAVENASYNARQLGMADRFELRRVPFEDQGAYAVLQPEERFDLILVDPPQGYGEDQARRFPEVTAELDRPRETFFASDVGSCFLRSLLAGLDQHLAPGGRLLVAMKVPRGDELLGRLVAERGFALRVLVDARGEAPPGRRIGDEHNLPDLGSKAVIYEITRR